MNERIQTLAVQAEDYADSIVDQGGEFHPAYTQKLAELIVRECATICVKVSDTTRIDSTPHEGDVCSYKIKSNFGVEE